MSLRVDEAEIRHLAQLARLSLGDDEVARFSQQLGRILEHLHVLATLDLEDDSEQVTEPTNSQDSLRLDQVTTSVTAKTALSSAPDPQGDCFRVPRALDPA